VRALVYFVAVTLDGRIAGPDGRTDFFPTDEAYLAWLAEHWGDSLPTGLHEAMGTAAPVTRWDTVVMGRGTFEPAIAADVESPYAHLEQYVFSASLDPAAHPGVRVVAQDALAFVRGLKAREGGDIWLCGGGALAGALATEVDRLVLKVNPVVAGDGVPLFGGGFDPSTWRLVEHEVAPGGVVVLTYDRAAADQPVGMGHEGHVAALQGDLGLLLEAVERAGLDTAVPSCPGWTVRDLVDHVSEVYRHKTACIRLGAEPEPWPPVRDLSDPVAELRAAFGELHAELAGHAATDPAFTWHEPDQTVGFWSRRMAQETAVHRVDAELAAAHAGSATVHPVAEDLAADGIDEVLVVFAEGDWSDLPQPGPGLVVRLEVPGRSWTVHLLPGELRVEQGRSTSDPDLTVNGRASDLLLWLWGRGDLEALTVTGDPAGAHRLVDRLSHVTS
jgi:uncharacterized protein (TIGR03083 family)